MKARKPLAERFWAKVDKTDTCWNWTGYTMKRGYGQIGYKGSVLLAHRVSYEMANGPIAEGLVVDHKCHNTGCVNPAHLHAVTQKQNSENRNISGSSASGVRGVHWHEGSRKWAVRVRVGEKLHYGGTYTSVKEAEAAAIDLRNSLYTNNLADRISA